MSIGDNIKKVRLEKNIKQSELAKKLGVSPSMIAQYENGTRKPKRDTVRRIAKELGVFDHQLDPSMIMTFASGEEFDKTWKKITNDSHIQKMNTLMEKLNGKGQDKAIEQVEMITKISEYQKDKE